MFEWIIFNWQSITLIITGVISVASVIVKLTPNTKDNELLDKIIKVLEVLALNKSGEAK